MYRLCGRCRCVELGTAEICAEDTDSVRQEFSTRADYMSHLI